MVSGIDGSFRLSNIAVRNEFRNCSLTVIVASAAGALAARRSRVVVSWALTKESSRRISKKVKAALAFINQTSFFQTKDPKRRRCFALPPHSKSQAAAHNVM